VKEGTKRDAAYLAYIRQKNCLICQVAPPVQAHHWAKHGTGIKCSDYDTVPLCWECHGKWHNGEFSKTSFSHRYFIGFFRRNSATLNEAFFNEDAF